MSSRKAYERQNDMVKTNEMMAMREKDFRMEELTKFRGEWAESQEQTIETQKMKANEKIIKEELVIASKALIAVRQAALRKLIMEENSQYEKELQLQGKTFYVQRM